ncbi:MAG: hypothetical protein LBB83_00685, partial [Treponema sp.]|nr:hypothetical protein [Treponema sp.]
MKITTVIKSASFYPLSLLLPLIGALFFSSCNQDDIFYQIQYETALRDPLIKGGPSKIVKSYEEKGQLNEDGEMLSALYVASGRIWTYPKGSGWRGMSDQPPGIKVLDIAATSGYLYAVTSNGVDLGDSGYYRYGKNASSGDYTWEPVDAPSHHPKPTAIYGAGDVLFAGAASGSNYAVYALKDGETEFKLIQNSDSLREGMLLGAEKWDGMYFFSLDGQGVFKVANPDSTEFPVSVPGSADKGNFTGFAVVDNAVDNTVDNTLLMVSTSGVICQLTSAGDSISDDNSHSLDFGFTGAL